MIKQILLFIILTASCIITQAQPSKEIIDRQQIWLGYLSQTRLTNKLGFWFDGHFRTNDFASDVSQLIARPGLTYYLADNIRLTAGYAYIYFPSEDGTNNRHHEHRPWQQIWMSNKYKGFQTIQWIRFEQRYVQKVVDEEAIQDYNFNYRLRYNLMVQIPLKGKEIQPKKPFLVIQDELFINFGKEIIYNYFDQNRFFVGLGYPFSSHFNAQLGYSNIFQQRRSGNTFFDTHALRLFVFHNLDFRKKEKNKLEKSMLQSYRI